jgi:tryptophanyl-tRNA synthetase
MPSPAFPVRTSSGSDLPSPGLPGAGSGTGIIVRIVSSSSTASVDASGSQREDTRGRVLTGFRPTGDLHIGHWAGNVGNAVRLQDEGYECYYFVANWHMLTTHYDRTAELSSLVEAIVLDLLACGIDPDRSTLYLQSDLLEVAEMALLLGMITPLGWLERVPTYKERLRDMAERDVSNFGLLGYPVLQTVDITIVRGELVPVGEDQVSHLEISREIVRRFNRLFGEVLVEPQPLLSDFPLVPGSDGRKMSKSLDNAVGIADDPDTIRAKVRSFITDPQKVRLGDPGRPEICPIFALHTRFSPDIVDWTRDHCRSGELGCVDCKTNLADRLIEELRPIRERRLEFASEPGLVWKVLGEGSERVRPIVRETLDAVRDAMGFSRP